MIKISAGRFIIGEDGFLRRRRGIVTRGRDLTRVLEMPRQTIGIFGGFFTSHGPLTAQLKAPKLLCLNHGAETMLSPDLPLFPGISTSFFKGHPRKLGLTRWIVLNCSTLQLDF